MYKDKCHYINCKFNCKNIYSHNALYALMNKRKLEKDEKDEKDEKPKSLKVNWDKCEEYGIKYK